MSETQTIAHQLIGTTLLTLKYNRSIHIAASGLPWFDIIWIDARTMFRPKNGVVITRDDHCLEYRHIGSLTRWNGHRIEKHNRIMEMVQKVVEEQEVELRPLLDFISECRLPGWEPLDDLLERNFGPLKGGL